MPTKSVSQIILIGLVFCGLQFQAACGGGHKSKSGPEVSTLDFPPAGGNATLSNRTSGAYTFPATNLHDDELNLHTLGDALFDKVYESTAGSADSGLGPLFNNVSCRSCHILNGRGRSLMGDDGGARSPMLTRISIDPSALAQFPGSLPSPGNGPIGVPGLGGQLQDYSAFGVQPEAHITLTWVDVPGSYPDGTTYILRRPVQTFTGVNEALLNTPGVLKSIRQTPPVFGLGLLEAVPDDTLLALEDPTDKNGDGIKGHLNRVWDPVKGSLAIGRFGWKASAPSVLVQTANALAEDMGVSNPLRPEVNGSSDINNDALVQTAYYAQTLAVPARSTVRDATTNAGGNLFVSIGCESCHKSQLTTGNTYAIVSLRNQTFSPFTDLLLHDMGEGLADHRPDFAASGSEWRTQPLWGIGLSQTVLPGSAYLHDGRAHSFEEAILWHGGEAQKSQEAFKKLPLDQRKAVLNFLKSL
ncbi:MAG: thiol oxidoreductase [Chitinophagaceae bacterium]|nr:thiol oxidoreductase [Oligoflexus sp.]